MLSKGEDLHPAVEPFDRRKIAVDSHHTLYLEQFGRADGIAALFLHGGPGSGCQRAHARLFDPTRFRAVLFDQRGAGLSTPKLSLTDNTTWHLVDDIERIRNELEIEAWMVVGGSWGSTLALAYAERHPERVLGRSSPTSWPSATVLLVGIERPLKETLRERSPFPSFRGRRRGLGSPMHRRDSRRSRR